MNPVVVTLTDSGYYQKAKRTIIDVRSRGEWKGDLVLITVGFDAPPNFLDYYRVIPFRVEHLDTSYLVEQYKKDPIRPTCDNREYGKLTQWDKFYVFDAYFKKWDRVVYLDAGLRCFQPIHHLSNLPCENSSLFTVKINRGRILQKTEISPGGIGSIISISLCPSKQSGSIIRNVLWKGFPYFMLKGKQQIHHGHFIASANGVLIHGVH